MSIPYNFNPLGTSGTAPGLVIMYGTGGKRKVMRDLNNDTNCSYLFCKQTIDGFLDGITFKNANDCSYMFYQAKILNWDFRGIKFENLKNASYMFYNATVPSENFDGITFENVTDASNMFQSHPAAVTLKDATFKKVTNASSMFSGSSTDVYLPNATFENVTNVGSFHGGSSSSHLYIPQATFEKVTNVTYAFEHILNFDLPKATFNSLVNASNMTSNLYGTCEWSAATFKNVTNASSMFRGQTTSGTNFLTISLPAATFESLSNFSNMGTQNVRITNLHSINMQNASTATNFLNNSKLDKESVLQIANTIKDWSGDTEAHQIGMGISKDLENDAGVLQYLENIRAKNWTISPLNFN